jgi:hypothetical protein
MHVVLYPKKQVLDMNFAAPDAAVLKLMTNGVLAGHLVAASSTGRLWKFKRDECYEIVTSSHKEGFVPCLRVLRRTLVRRAKIGQQSSYCGQRE